MSAGRQKRKRARNTPPARKRGSTRGRSEPATAGDRYIAGCHPNLAALVGLEGVRSPSTGALFRDALALTGETEAEYREKFGEPTLSDACALLAKAFRDDPRALGRDITAALPPEILDIVLRTAPVRATRVSRRWHAIAEPPAREHRARQTERLLRALAELVLDLAMETRPEVDRTIVELALKGPSAGDKTGKEESARLELFSTVGEESNEFDIEISWSEEGKKPKYDIDYEEAVEKLATWMERHPDARVVLQEYDTDNRSQFVEHLDDLGLPLAAALLGVDVEDLEEYGDPDTSWYDDVMQYEDAVVGEYETDLASPNRWLRAFGDNPRLVEDLKRWSLSYRAEPKTRD